jgi:hypothetical protein
MILYCGFAKDIESANSVMDDCRAYLLPEIPHDSYFNAGSCSGITTLLNQLKLRTGEVKIDDDAAH